MFQHWTFVVTGSPQGNSCGLRNYPNSPPTLIDIPNQSQNIISGDLNNPNFNFGSIWVFKSSLNYPDKVQCANWCLNIEGCESAIFMDGPLFRCVLNDFRFSPVPVPGGGKELEVAGSSYTNMVPDCNAYTR